VTRPQPAEHRTIIVVDIERFGDPLRTNPDRVTVRDGMYLALQQAFNRAGIPWDRCYREDRGDGALILAPPQLHKSRFAEFLPGELARALNEHNRAHHQHEQIRLRVALHAGEVSIDDHGVTGTSVNLAFRLLEVPEFKEALAGSPGVIALIASDWFFEEVIRHAAAACPATYRRARVEIKETSTIAWIARPDHPYPEAQPKLTAGQRNLLNVFHDASGKVTVSVFELQSPSQQESFTDFGVDVPSDMVAIGGGGMGAEFPEGALLTASYPNSDLSSWLVSAKDHYYPNPFILTAYAIGMKIEGLTRQQLLDYIAIVPQQSGLAGHPRAEAALPPGFLLVSGGINVNWDVDPGASQGNFATASCPQNNSAWFAASKDQHYVSPANLTAYAIGLKEDLPIGTVNVFISPPSVSAVAPHPSSTSVLPGGYALTGGGAMVSYGAGYGNLLWMLQPSTGITEQNFTAASKDQIEPSPATISTYSIGIQVV
jgi:hypothetical protein